MTYLSLINRRGAIFGSIAACVQMLLMPGVALADSVIWAHQASGFTSNGAVVIKSLSGGTYSGTQNPTGAVAKVNQSAVTQPPTVIVQATASLPIKAVGDPCTQSTSGSAPNQTAGEGTAITADRSLLLTCQFGGWKPSMGMLGQLGCKGSYGASYLIACVDLKSGALYFADQVSGSQRTFVTTGWPIEWASQQFRVGCSADSSTYYVASCIAPDQKKYCFINNASASVVWICRTW